MDQQVSCPCLQLDWSASCCCATTQLLLMLLPCHLWCGCDVDSNCADAKQPLVDQSCVLQSWWGPRGLCVVWYAAICMDPIQHCTQQVNQVSALSNMVNVTC